MKIIWDDECGKKELNKISKLKDYLESICVINDIDNRLNDDEDPQASTSYYWSFNSKLKCRRTLLPRSRPIFCNGILKDKVNIVQSTQETTKKPDASLKDPSHWP